MTSEGGYRECPAVVVQLLAEHLKRLFYLVPVRVNDQSLALAPASDR
jgi:hypothetical protein